MRRGLVMAGGGLLVLGLLVVSVGLLDFPQTTGTQASGPLSTFPIPAGGFRTQNLSPAVQGVISGGNIEVQYSTSGPVDAYLLRGTGACQSTDYRSPSPSCILQFVGSKASGSLSTGSATSFPYVVDLVDPANVSVNGLGSFSVVSDLTQGIPLWQVMVILAAGGLLSVIGGVAAFLGFYLQGDPYAAGDGPASLPTPEPLPEGGEEGGATRDEHGGVEGDRSEAKPSEERARGPVPRPAAPAKPAPAQEPAEEKVLW